MVEYEVEWCDREEKTKWCKRKKKEFTGWNGVFLGVTACYIPDDCKICFGKEYLGTVWMHHKEEEAIRFLIDVICHEEDHRAIHEVTKSKRAALTFDYLFVYPFDFKVNLEWFRVSDIDLWGTGDLSPYGKMLMEKAEKAKMMKERT